MVAVANRRAPAAQADLLAEALDAAGLWERLAGIPGEVLVIAGATGDRRTSVDPVLVEQLVDELYAHGFERVVVAAVDGRLRPAPGIRRLDLGGVTAHGSEYGLVELGADVAEGPFPGTGVLRGMGIPRVWLEAGFRINLAKNATHAEFGYALCLANLLGLPDSADRHQDLVADRDTGEVLVELLRHCPADFHLVDALASSHGPAGTEVPVPITTGTLLAGDDALAVDLVGARLMGAEPLSSPLLAAAVAEFGTPEVRIDGDATPYAGWRNPAPELRAARRGLRTDGALRRVLAAVGGQGEEDPLLVRLRDWHNGLVEASVDSPLATRQLRKCLAALGYLDRLANAWQVIGAKDRVPRPEVGLGIDPTDYGPADFAAVEELGAELETLAAQLPWDESGMRWRYLDGAVLFGCQRTINAPYTEFTPRVEIDRAIEFMQDYLGGQAIEVAHDAEGRVIRRLERNLYLPQPNYVALFGGPVIDVCKVESIRYSADTQRIRWRTVRSPNGSADYDDGSVTFERVGAEQTRIAITVRQKFALPPALRWFDEHPEIKAPLVTDAYRRFFGATLDNFEARYEGRLFRIGREGAAGPLLTTTAHTLFELGREWVRQPRPETEGIDLQGFRHFRVGPAEPDQLAETIEELRPVARDFLAGLRAAIERDQR
ncbi:hypothetical protein GCM10010452_75540 [Crossiella cryophila]